ncbi:MAG: glycosyltransferase family 2 protein [Hungatella sp.]
MKPFFSIVMPAYGVEKYITKAVESILAQTYENWELIVVDDCSPDQSGKIAEEYAKKEAKMKVVHHKVNQGLSTARNTGEKAATGEYIWFMDSDDTVEADLLQKVYDSLQKNPAKIVVFGLQEEYYEKDGSFAYRHNVIPEEHYYANYQELRKYIIYLEQETLYGYAWNKMYCLEYLRKLQLQYENIRLIEDILFNVKFCMDIDSMNTLPIAPYHYAKRLENSLTNKFVPDYYKLHQKRIEIIFKQYQYWNMDTQEVRGILGSLYARYILSALQRNCDPRAQMTYRRRYGWCKTLCSKELFKELIPSAKAKDSRALELLLWFLKRENKVMCLTMGRAVYIVKNKLPMVYSKVKSGR